MQKTSRPPDAKSSTPRKVANPSNYRAGPEDPLEAAGIEGDFDRRMKDEIEKLTGIPLTDEQYLEVQQSFASFELETAEGVPSERSRS